MRESELQKYGSMRSTSDVEELIRNTFHEEKEINFAGFLKYEILKGSSGSGKEEALQTLFQVWDT